MFVVLFQVEPRPDRWDDYLRYAAILRPELEKIDGFFDNRRFRSRGHAGRLLSLSLWRDEKALVRWRAHPMHHGVQAKGRAEVFRDYDLRVGEVVRDNGAVQTQFRFDETQAGSARAVSIIEQPPSEVPPGAPGLLDWDLFDGVLDASDRCLLLFWRDSEAMETATLQGGGRRLDVRIVRHYGLSDRAEAPQFHA